LRCEETGEDRWIAEGFSTVSSRLGFLARASVYSLDFPGYSGPGWQKKAPKRGAAGQLAPRRAA
jgi:hypothetical protein